MCGPSVNTHVSAPRKPIQNRITADPRRHSQAVIGRLCTKKMTQREAVKQALAAGKELPPDGVKFVKDTFNIQSFSTLKQQIN